MSLFQIPIDQTHANGLISSYYKPRGGGFHDGIDYRAANGTEVLAAYGGTIIRASDMPESGSFGNVIIIDHGVINGRRTYTLYAHLSDFSSAVGPDGEALLDENGQPRDWMAGDTVAAGQLIGLSGNTPLPSNPDDPEILPHLHFEVLQSLDAAEITFNTNPGVGGGVGFDTALYAVNPLQFVYGDGVNISHELNTIDDTGEDYATAWGDIGNDRITTPEPTTGEDSLGRSLKFTAGNLYGKRGDDYLEGNINDDRLHGGFGNDTLIGGAGADILWGWQENADSGVRADGTFIVPERIRELADDGGDDILIGGISRTEDDNAADSMYGGDGFDTYFVGNGDVINDTDGKGRVVYNDTVLLSGYRESSDEPGEYQSLDGRFTYTLNSGVLTVADNTNPSMSFTVNGFDSGELGIHLTQRPEAQNPVSATDANEAIMLNDDPGDPNPFVLTIDDLDSEALTETNYLTRPDAIRGMGGNDRIRIYDVDDQGITIWGDSQGANPELDGNDVIEIDPYRTDGVPSPAPTATENGATIYGEGGDDTIAGALNNDWIDGGTGHDMVFGFGGDDVVLGRSGNDWLNGNDGDDAVIGHEDNDRLFGGAGHDVLLGGTGNDRLYADSDGGRFIVLEDGTRQWNGDTESVAPVDAVPEIILDVAIAQAGNDWLDGGEGDDYLFGGAGNDQILGGSGDDHLYGEAGDDHLMGRAGFDVLYGDKDEQVYTNDNVVIATSIDPETGQPVETIFRRHQDDATVAGNDILDGGGGNDIDFLYGGGGNDTYIFNEGYGLDVIDDESGSSDSLQLGAGISPDNVELERAGDNLVVRPFGDPLTNQDIILIQNWFGDGRIENIRFSNGIVWDWRQVQNYFARQEQYANEDLPNIASITVGDDGDNTGLVGGIDNDFIYAFGGNDQIQGGAGDDQLFGADGDDLLFGQDGNDFLYGQNGNDELQGNLGNDFLFGGAGHDVLFGQEDDDQLFGEAGDDEVYGNEGDDVLSGGAGSDELIGGIGSDTYLFNRGDGDDVVRNTVFRSQKSAFRMRKAA
jgi:Ca2+-binding RTX toxin-like protein